MHNIGLVINAFEVSWTKEIIEKNNKILATQFPNLNDAMEFYEKINSIKQLQRVIFAKEAMVFW